MCTSYLFIYLIVMLFFATWFQRSSLYICRTQAMALDNPITGIWQTIQTPNWFEVYPDTPPLHGGACIIWFDQVQETQNRQNNSEGDEKGNLGRTEAVSAFRDVDTSLVPRNQGSCDELGLTKLWGKLKARQDVCRLLCCFNTFFSYCHAPMDK